MKNLSKKLNTRYQVEIDFYLSQLYQSGLLEICCYYKQQQNSSKCLNLSAATQRPIQKVPLKYFLNEQSEENIFQQKKTLKTLLNCKKNSEMMTDTTDNLEKEETTETLKKNISRDRQLQKQAKYAKMQINTLEIKIQQQNSFENDSDNRIQTQKETREFQQRKTLPKTAHKFKSAFKNESFIFKPAPISIIGNNDKQANTHSENKKSNFGEKSLENFNSSKQTLLQNFYQPQKSGNFDLQFIDQTLQKSFNQPGEQMFEYYRRMGKQTTLQTYYEKLTQDHNFDQNQQNFQKFLSFQKMPFQNQQQNFDQKFFNQSYSQCYGNDNNFDNLMQNYNLYKQNQYQVQQQYNQQQQNQFENPSSPKFDINYYINEHRQQRQFQQQNQQMHNDVQLQLENFNQTRQKKKSKKEKTIIFVNKKEILIVLFHSAQFQLNNCLGNFKRPKNYALQKNQEKAEEKKYFQCIFQFKDKDTKKLYWDNLKKLYNDISYKSKSKCQFLRRGQYITKAILDTRTFYRDDKKYFLDFIQVFNSNQNQLPIKSYKIKEYVLKLHTKDNKFILERNQNCKDKEQYVGSYKISKKNSKYIPDVIKGKNGNPYAIKCLYRKFSEESYWYYVSHVDFFYFCMLNESQNLYFVSSFVEGLAKQLQD